MTKHIACGPLTGRIYQGRVNKAGNAFIGNKEDITNLFLQALIEKAEYHKGSFQIVASDGRSWTVTVTEDVK